MIFTANSQEPIYSNNAIVQKIKFALCNNVTCKATCPLRPPIIRCVALTALRLELCCTQCYRLYCERCCRPQAASVLVPEKCSVNTIPRKPNMASLLKIHTTSCPSHNGKINIYFDATMCSLVSWCNASFSGELTCVFSLGIHSMLLIMRCIQSVATAWDKHGLSVVVPDHVMGGKQIHVQHTS